MTGSVKRVFAGFALAPILPSVVYTLVSWGVAGFEDFFVYVIGVAYLITMVLFVPEYLFLLFKGKVNFLTILLTSFFSLFVVFFVLYLIMHSYHTTLVVGDNTLVENGTITLAGYKNVLSDAISIGLIGMLGGMVFYLVSFMDFVGLRRSRI